MSKKLFPICAVLLIQFQSPALADNPEFEVHLRAEQGQRIAHQIADRLDSPRDRQLIYQLSPLRIYHLRQEVCSARNTQSLEQYRKSLKGLAALEQKIRIIFFQSSPCR